MEGIPTVGAGPLGRRISKFLLDAPSRMDQSYIFMVRVDGAASLTRAGERRRVASLRIAWDLADQGYLRSCELAAQPLP